MPVSTRSQDTPVGEAAISGTTLRARHTQSAAILEEELGLPPAFVAGDHPCGVRVGGRSRAAGAGGSRNHTGNSRRARARVRHGHEFQQLPQPPCRSPDRTRSRLRLIASLEVLPLPGLEIRELPDPLTTRQIAGSGKLPRLDPPPQGGSADAPVPTAHEASAHEDAFLRRRTRLHGGPFRSSVSSLAPSRRSSRAIPRRRSRLSLASTTGADGVMTEHAPLRFDCAPCRGKDRLGLLDQRGALVRVHRAPPEPIEEDDELPALAREQNSRLDRLGDASERAV